MGLIFSPALVLAPDDDLPLWPLVLWDNLVTFSNVTSSSEVAAYPVTNLANVATHLRWLSNSTAEQTVTITVTADAANAVGIARHNLGSSQCSIAIEVLSADVGATWETVLEDTYLGNDDPALLIFEEQIGLAGLRLRLKPNGTAPTIAVLYAGRALRIQTGITPGFTPIVDGTNVEKVDGISEGGELLGESIVTRVSLSTSAQFTNIDPDWYRDNMRSFVVAANRGRPFFFAALPDWFPREVGYCWFPDGFSARPTMEGAMGRISLQLQMSGIAS